MTTIWFRPGPKASRALVGASALILIAGMALAQTTPIFTFTEDAQGWEFRQTPAFHPPLHDVIPEHPGMLRLQADNNNTSTFGYWESPVFLIEGLGSSEITGAIRIPADNTGDSLYVAQFHVAGNAAPAQAPQMRLRATSVSLSKSAMLVVDSQGDGAYSPRTEPQSYPLVFVPSPDSIGFRVAFELLNFSPDDNANGVLDLHSLLLYRVPTTLVSSLRVEKTFSFDEDAEGWTFTAPAPFDTPGGRQEAGALVLQSGPGENVFGYWTSPIDDQSVIIEPNRFYLARFTIASDVASLLASKVPGFRCRLHEETFRLGSIVGIESLTGQVSPVEGSPREIDVYFQPPPHAIGKRLVLAFDIAKFAFGDSDVAQLRLEDVSILSGQYLLPN